MKKTLIVATLAALVVAPAFADRLVIDDDRWYVDDDRPTSRAIDIDDDNWSYVDTPAVTSQRSGGAPGECTSLERSADIDTADCGMLSRAEVIKRLSDMNDES
ncbi:hypothetical protein [Jannaschia marina]|uniref:hypothetical protein n=1 Tax=Jannaschia marina TaxID=2741674 RepID=UPI0015CDBCE5|nr:hypothetical protein [Jannaschia marina]